MSSLIKSKAICSLDKAEPLPISSRTLPAEQSELAQQLIKDPYSFDFLSLAPDMLERDLERGLIEHLRSLILELGKGFAFVGSQYPLEVGGQDYYLDLLFYHLRLRCFVVIELKVEEFETGIAYVVTLKELVGARVYEHVEVRVSDRVEEVSDADGS